MTRTLTVLLVASLSALAAWQLKPDKEALPPAAALISVQEMGALVSLKVNYANVIEFNERATRDIPWTQWELRLGGTRVLLVARGECLIGTDLKLARYEQIAPASKTSTLVLPQPTVMSARLNHDANNGGSYFYAVSSTGIDALVPDSDGQTKAINSALEKGQRDVQASCAKPELIEAARKSAQAVLQPTLAATGWKVALVWR